MVLSFVILITLLIHLKYLLDIFLIRLPINLVSLTMVNYVHLGCCRQRELQRYPVEDQRRHIAYRCDPQGRWSDHTNCSTCLVRFTDHGTAKVPGTHLPGRDSVSWRGIVRRELLPQQQKRCDQRAERNHGNAAVQCKS